jgi:hypothetical protein
LLGSIKINDRAVLDTQRAMLPETHHLDAVRAMRMIANRLIGREPRDDADNL